VECCAFCQSYLTVRIMSWLRSIPLTCRNGFFGRYLIAIAVYPIVLVQAITKRNPVGRILCFSNSSRPYMPFGGAVVVFGPFVQATCSTRFVLCNCPFALHLESFFFLKFSAGGALSIEWLPRPRPSTIQSCVNN
jgi:hypothetical protein